MAGLNVRWIVPSLIMTGMWTAPALAQAQAARPLAALPRLDAAGYVGWFNANKSSVATYNDWYNRSVYGGFSFGHYWTDHIKTEVELARTSEAEVDSYELIHTPGATLPRPTEHYYRNVKVSLTQIYQFSRNTWFHPFCGAGLEIDWERQWEEAEELAVFRGPVIPGIRTEPRTDVHPKAAASAGFKAYLSPRTFFRTDVKLVGARQLDQAIWRFGVGVDF